MKVLLDEMLPIGVRELLPSHDVSTAAYAGLAGLPNGELIDRAVAAGFDVLVSLDRGILYQQNLTRRHWLRPDSRQRCRPDQALRRSPAVRRQRSHAWHGRPHRAGWMILDQAVPTLTWIPH